MLYALLKTVHLLSVVVWMGGMFFMLFCLHPAALKLEPAVRLPLLRDAVGRFLDAAGVAAALVLASGVWIIGRVAQAGSEAGLGFAMPLDWYVMAGLGAVMVAVYVHIRWVLFKRVRHAVDAGDWATGGAALKRIRGWVMLNFDLGLLIIVVTRFGTVS